MKEGNRVFKTGAQDVLNSEEAVAAAINSGLAPEAFERHETIPESKITAFCKPCDHFKGEGIPCPIVKSDDQARYALREWCGWASVKGVRGEMTAKGFKS